MAIPKQVQKQSERVEAMMRGDDTDEQRTDAPAQPEGQPEGEAVAAAEYDDASVSPAGVAPSEDEGADNAPAASDADLEQLKKQLEQTNQRYETLQGMIRQKDDTLRQMEMLITQMQQAAPAPQEQEQAAAPAQDEVKDREEFGDDYVDMVNRAIERRMNKLESRLAKTEHSAQQSAEYSAKSAQEQFYQKLDQRVPDWREIDDSQEFATWLKQSNARIALVKQAMADFDVDGIVELFEHYKIVSGKGITQQAESPAKPSLQSKVAPSKGRHGNSVATAPEKRMWTRSEIVNVYRARRNYSQKEFDELQREIFAAQKEGRVDSSK